MYRQTSQELSVLSCIYLSMYNERERTMTSPDNRGWHFPRRRFGKLAGFSLFLRVSNLKKVGVP
jgi:hypothetical protein